MTVKELINQESGNYTTFEVWAYSTKRCRVHTDFIENIDSVFKREAYENIEVDGWELMDEREYNRTICANCSDVSFEELYDDADAKVLVMMLTYDWNHHQLWYALQRDENDDWGTGTFDRDEAIKKMLDSEGYYTLIAVIENDVCIEEIHADQEILRGTYIVDMRDKEFFDSFYGSATSEEIEECQTNGIPSEELYRLYREWGVEEPFHDWINAHFLEK